MIDYQTLQQLKKLMENRMYDDMAVLDKLREEISILKGEVRRITPRNATSISLVGTDGGNNKLQFDPFLVQIIRVVDSSNNEYYMDVITPTTKVEEINERIFHSRGNSMNSLKKLMEYLNIDDITKLSPMIRYNKPDKPVSPSWVQVYRELVEWATLFSLVREKDFGTNTLIVYDGLLRSKVFTGDLFARFRRGVGGRNKESIREKSQKNLYFWSCQTQ